MRRLIYYGPLWIRQGLSLAWRNRFSSLVTGAVIAMLLTLVYVFAAITEHTRQAGHKVDDRLLITATVAQDADYHSLVPATQLAVQVRQLPNVRGVRILSREQVRDTFLRAAGGIKTPPAAYIFNEILEIQVVDVDQIGQTAARIRALRGIEQATYLQKLVEKLTAVSDYLQRAALYAALLMTMIAILVVMLTVRSAIHAERRSLEISASVGGSPWAIAAPHVVHMVLISTLASVVACLIGYVLDPQVGSSFAGQIQNLPSWLRTGRSYGLFQLLLPMVAASGAAVTLIVLWSAFRYSRRVR